MNRIIEWIKSLLPCRHEWVYDPVAQQEYYDRVGFRLFYERCDVCKKCGMKEQHSTPQSREPWRDW